MAIFGRKKKRHPIKYKGNQAATIGAEHRWTILLWMWRHAVVDAGVVSELIGCSRKTATNKLRQIEQRQLIQARVVHGRKIYWLTSKGGSEARGIARAYPDRIDIPHTRVKMKTEPSRWPATGNIPHELLVQLYIIRIVRKIEGQEIKGTVRRVAGNRDFLSEDPWWKQIIEYRGRPIVPDAAVHWIDDKGKDRYWFGEIELDSEKSDRERSRRIYHYSQMLRANPTAEAVFVFQREATQALWSETTVHRERLESDVYGGQEHHRWVRSMDRGEHIEDDPPPNRLKYKLLTPSLYVYLPDYRR